MSGMDLPTYKAKERLTLTELAARLERPVSTVHGWLKGWRKPEPDDLRHIEERTDGKVKPADLRPDLAALFKRQPRALAARASMPARSAGAASTVEVP